MTSVARTYLAYLRDAKLHRLRTTVEAVHPFSALDPSNKALFKQGSDEDHVVITSETVFHPQGGGQPTDEGAMTLAGSEDAASPDPSSSSMPRFAVSAVRMDAVDDGQVLHLGRFSSPTSRFAPGDSVEQSVDTVKRLLYSRYHTAGHVLDAAVRSVVEDTIGFDKMKASHFPDSAGCEFKGSIEGKWKDAIQAKLSEYIAAGLQVEVDWWDEEDFRRHGQEKWIPDRPPPPGEKYRVIKIGDIDYSPCGGTHVETTDVCGEAKVRKITRNKGVSRVAYAVA